MHTTKHQIEKILEKPFIALILLLFCIPLHAESLQLSQRQQENLGLKVAAASVVTVSSSQSFPAKVVVPNNNQYGVYSPQAGIVLQLFKAVGDTVEQDEVMAVVNSPDLITIQRDYLQAYGRLKQVDIEWQRIKQLFSEGIAAERRYQDIRSQRELARNEYQALEQQLRLIGLSQDDLDELRSNGKYNSTLQLYSETDGVVMKQLVLTGQQVGAMDNLYMVADLSTLWLEVHVPLDFVKRIQLGEQASVDGRHVSGEVIAIGREVHEADQGVMVRVLINQHTDLLTPGEFVQVKFHKSTTAQLYEVPQSAVLFLEGTAHIFVENEAGFSPVPVDVHSERAGKALITTSHEPLNRVVVEGLAALKAAWNNR
jgi:membrane fusion protein, heavy metal efflux system